MAVTAFGKLARRRCGELREKSRLRRSAEVSQFGVHLEFFGDFLD